MLLISSIDLIHYVFMYLVNDDYEELFMINDQDVMELRRQSLNNVFNAIDVSGFTIGQNIFAL